MIKQKGGLRNQPLRGRTRLVQDQKGGLQNRYQKEKTRFIPNQAGLSAIVVILILILLLALGGGGYFVYQQKQARALPPQTAFDYINLNEDVTLFLFQRIPRLYSRIRQLNTELTMIATELERIGELENEYPSGKRIVQAERNVWVKLQKKLQVIVQSTEKKVESYYVAYMVNKETAKELINESLDGLLSQVDDILEMSKKETRRLKVVTKQTFMEKLKALF